MDVYGAYWAAAGAGRRMAARPRGEHAPRRWLRLGVEFLELRADRPAPAFAGSELEAGARRAQAELRVRF